MILKPTTQHPLILRRISEAERADIAGMNKIIRILIEMRESAIKKQKNNCIYMKIIQEKIANLRKDREDNKDFKENNKQYRHEDTADI